MARGGESAVCDLLFAQLISEGLKGIRTASGNQSANRGEKCCVCSKGELFSWKPYLNLFPETDVTKAQFLTLVSSQYAKICVQHVRALIFVFGCSQ